MSRISAVLVAVLAVGCGTARVVYQSGNTGTIELSGDREKAMSQANDELTTMCGANNATIIAQGFERPGTPPEAAPPAQPAVPDANGNGVVWRIRFQCGATAPKAPPAPLVAAPPPG